MLWPKMKHKTNRKPWVVYINCRIIVGILFMYKSPFLFLFFVCNRWNTNTNTRYHNKPHFQNPSKQITTFSLQPKSILLFHTDAVAGDFVSLHLITVCTYTTVVCVKTLFWSKSKSTSTTTEALMCHAHTIQMQFRRIKWWADRI